MPVIEERKSTGSVRKRGARMRGAAWLLVLGLSAAAGRAQPAPATPAQPAPATLPQPAPATPAQPASATPAQPAPSTQPPVPAQPRPPAGTVPVETPPPPPPPQSAPGEAPAPAQAAEPSPAPAPAPAPAAAPAAPPAAPAPAPPPPAPEPSATFTGDVTLEPVPETPDVRVGLGVAFGVLSLPTLGVGLTGLVQLEKLLPMPLELSATYGFASEHELTAPELDLGPHPFVIYAFPRGGARLVVHDVRAQLALCPIDHPLSSGTVRLCAGMHGGALLVDAEGLPEVDSQTRGIVGADLYARFSFALVGPLSLTYSAGLSVPFVRDRFGFIDPYLRYQEHFRASVVTARLDLLVTLAL